jgi:hypothetical protein
MDYKVAFERTAQSLALTTKALRECQKLLCPEWGSCAEWLQDGEKCACGFEDGPFANSVPKNRDADTLRARVADLVDALIEVVNHGNASGDPELMAKLKRLTPEAGWTE